MNRGRLTPSSGARLRVAALALALLAPACSAPGGDTDGSSDSGSPGAAPTTMASAERPYLTEPLTPPEDVERLDGITDLSSLPSRPDTFAAWRSVVPRIEDVRIPSTVDDNVQRALWLEPRGDQEQPLIVALHSWSTRYVQYFNSPFGRWADQEGWGMIAPDFRGAFRRPVATGSDLAVQDVVDAIGWAVARGGVDPARVFVIGFSGGGMMSLLMAGQHPDLLAGAVSWVPVLDLGSWYAYNLQAHGGNRYAREIEASCGGNPLEDEQAGQECLARSPRAHLDAAREAGLPVYLGHGLSDRTVPPDHALRAFNELAEEPDQLPRRVVEAVAEGDLPDDVPGAPAEHFFDAQDPRVLLARRSGPVTLVLFEGRHDMVFHPGLKWMAALAERLD